MDDRQDNNGIGVFHGNVFSSLLVATNINASKMIYRKEKQRAKILEVRREFKKFHQNFHRKHYVKGKQIYPVDTFGWP